MQHPAHCSSYAELRDLLSLPRKMSRSRWLLLLLAATVPRMAFAADAIAADPAFYSLSLSGTGVSAWGTILIGPDVISAARNQAAQVRSAFLPVCLHSASVRSCELLLVSALRLWALRFWPMVALSPSRICPHIARQVRRSRSSYSTPCILPRPRGCCPVCRSPPLHRCGLLHLAIERRLRHRLRKRQYLPSLLGHVFRPSELGCTATRGSCWLPYRFCQSDDR